jgi:hypothetical protein
MCFRALLSIALLVCLPLHAGGGQVQPEASEFVANFYRWYVALAHEDHEEPAFALALKRDASIFSPELLKALRADAAAQAKVSGEIVGLDSDPFLNSQDPGENYEIGSVTQKGGCQFFSLHRVTGGKRQPQPAVMAEVEQKSGHWVFVNFHSVDGSDLLSVLKKLKAGRQGNWRK